MARQRSNRVIQLKEHLLSQLNEGVFLSGDRFPSARLIAADYQVSYQTAHRLLDELRAEGYVVRKSASGTYVSGVDDARQDQPFLEAVLILSSRARRPNSFGARLLSGLAQQLRRKGIPWSVEWADSIDDPYRLIPSSSLPVLWEAPQLLDYCCQTRRRAVLLNARPHPGIETALIDSVSLDDFFGGCCAADLLLKNTTFDDKFIVVAGPDDPRSDDRRDGFLSRARNSSVIYAGGWYVEDGLTIATRVINAQSSGIFCVNDRLAQAIVTTARQLGKKRPKLVGFDNAPVAAELNLTTIAIPWNELLTDAAHMIQRRLTGDSSAARRHLVTPQAIVRDP